MKRWHLIPLLTGLLHAQEVSPVEPPRVEPTKTLEAKPSRDLFDLATLYYNEASEAKDPTKKTQNHRLAARNFDRFLRAYPKDLKAIDAWYFLALSYRQLDEVKASRTCFETVATRWDSGKYVSGAALHLASDDYEKKEWQSAAKWFLTLSRATDDPKIRHEAHYRRFLCFNELKDHQNTRASLELILKAPENPYLEAAQLALARLHQNAKDYQQAFPLYVQLTSSKKPEISSESTLQAALCAQAANHQEQSYIWFEKALNHPGLKDWRGQTQLTLMNLFYQEKNYAEVVRVLEKGSFKLAAQPSLQRLIIASKCYEALGREREALKLYQEISNLTPESETGFQASYRILVRDHSTGKKNFQKEASNFIARHEIKRANDTRLNSARLLLAESYYESKNYRRALLHFEKLNPTQIDPSNLLGTRYHEITCRLMLKMNQEAITSITAFQKEFPNAPQVLQLRLQRAEIFSKLARIDEALIDYKTVLSGTKDSKIQAIILQRLAAIYKEKEDHQEFAAIQRKFLMIPDISDTMKASAHFWLGLEYFRLKNYPKAQIELRSARQLHQKKFAEKVGPLLVRCAYQESQIDTLEQEIDLLKIANPKAKPPLPIVQWLGATLSQKGEHTRAWPFLHRSLHKSKDPSPLIWKLYADSALATSHPNEALRAADKRLELEDHPYRTAEALFQKAQAQTALKQYNEARQAASQALDLRPKGDLDLDLRLFAGDIDMAAKKPEDALRHYVVVESLYAKTKAHKISSIEKVIMALEAISTEKSKAKIVEYQDTLRQLKTL